MGKQQKFERWKRDSFLEARNRQLTAAKAAGDTIVMGGITFDHIVMDPHDDIICDDCNAGIETPYVNVVNYGRRAVCDDCLNENWMLPRRGKP